jgi:hypothetical protein
MQLATELVAPRRLEEHVSNILLRLEKELDQAEATIGECVCVCVVCACVRNCLCLPRLLLHQTPTAPARHGTARHRVLMSAAGTVEESAAPPVFGHCDKIKCPHTPPPGGGVGWVGGAGGGG